MMTIRLGVPLALLLALGACAGRAPDPSRGAPPAERAAAAAEASTRLAALLDEYFEAQLELDPLYATSIGDHRFDDRYTNRISSAWRAADLALQRRSLAALEAIDPALLDGEDRISWALFSWDRRLALEGYEHPTHLLPVNQFRSPANSFVQLGSGTSYHPFGTVVDYENFLSRIDGFIEWVDQAIANMREGMRREIVLPRVLVERMIPQLASQVVADPTESVFWRPIEQLPEDFSAGERERLTAAWRDAVGGKLIPAYERLRAFVADEYLAAARASYGLGALPGGPEWYAWLVRLNTTTALPPGEIHAIGLAEVERIQGEMRGVMSAVGFEGELADFFEFLNSDPRFYFERRDDLLDAYRVLREPVAAGTRPLFHRYPRADFEVRPIEAFRERSGAGAQYRPPDPEGTRPGVFFVNTYDLSARPSWAVESLYLHEAVPGHHFQNALRIETDGLPDYRRFASYVAYGEGWALYAESLGPEIGVYTDPYQYFGALAGELWRAIRRVVDTGLHHYGWTRQQVLDFMYANTAVKPARAESEAARYMAIPGQALGYKIGQLEILRLRERAADRLGEDFDIRDFHAVVLDSTALPMAVLEEQVERWLETGTRRAAAP
jgi:uncharacterized protein (DUF885 family)